MRKDKKQAKQKEGIKECDEEGTEGGAKKEGEKEVGR